MKFRHSQLPPSSNNRTFINGCIWQLVSAFVLVMISSA